MEEKKVSHANVRTTIRNGLQRLVTMDSIYLVFAFIIPVVIMYIIYIAMEIHPFGDGSVLVLDLNGQYVYFYEALRRLVYGDASLLYSFSRALGGEFMGIYAYYVASPFSYIVCLFPQTRILEALLFIFLLKTGLSGFTFGFYIHKTGKSRSKIATVIFSCMYALSAYAVVQQHNSMWIDALIWLPIISYAIEQLVKYGRFRMYVFFLALTLASNFYIGYMMCFWCLAYFFFYYISENVANKNNPLYEKHHFIKSFGRFAGYSLLSVGIATVILLTAYYSLKFGKTTFTDPSWSFSFKFDIIELLTKFLPGSYDTVRPEGLPFVYCGTLALILVPVFFLSSKFSAREKIMSGCMIMFFVLSFSISVVDLVWHGFQKPNWLNYRYSFMLCFFLLVLACRAFSEIQSVSSKAILAISAGIAGLIVFVQTLDYEYVDDLQTIWLSLLCVAVYLILLCLFKSSRFKENMLLIMAFAVSFELFANGLSNVVGLDKDVLYSGYSGYNNFMAALRPIVNTTMKNDPSFYRMEKTIQRKVNDNMTLGIRGISNSTSTLNASTIEFLHNMGYPSASHWSSTNYYDGVDQKNKYSGNPVNNALLGIKYMFSSDDLSDDYERAYTVGDYSAWLNPYALSLAYGVATDLTQVKADDYDTPMDYMNALITAMLGEEETVQVFVPVELSSAQADSNCTSSFIAGHYKYAKNKKGDEDVVAAVHYTTTVPTDGKLYCYVPSDCQRRVCIKANSKLISSFGYGGEAKIITLGTFEEGDNFRLTLELSKDIPSRDISFTDLYIKKGCSMVYYIDEAVFADAMTRLAQCQYDITEFDDSHFKGTITTTNESQTILTTIPYDAVWQIYVDGEKVETFETLDALIAFNITSSGTHEVRMKYMPREFVLGLTVTLISIGLFVVLIVFRKHLVIKDRRPEDAENADDDGDGNGEMPCLNEGAYDEKAPSDVQSDNKENVKKEN